MIEVYTQVELDKALAKTNGGKDERIVCRGSGRFSVGGSASVEAWGSASVVAWDSASVRAGTSQAIEARRKLRAALNSDTDGGTDG